MSISDLLISKPYVLLLPITILSLIAKKWSKIIKNSIVQGLTTLPIVGGIIRKSSAAVAFRCLSLLLESGVRINKVFKLRLPVHLTFITENFFSRVQNHVNEGLGFSESFLMESHWLGDDGRNVCGIMEIASETGSATDMLEEIADDYEEVDTLPTKLIKCWSL